MRSGVEDLAFRACCSNPENAPAPYFLLNSEHMLARGGYRLYAFEMKILSEICPLRNVRPRVKDILPKPFHSVANRQWAYNSCRCRVTERFRFNATSGIRRVTVKSARPCVAASLAAALLTAMLTPLAQAQTYKEKVLYSFTGGTNGANPLAGLIFDSSGNLYGTANDDDYNCGTVL